MTNISKLETHHGLICREVSIKKIFLILLKQIKMGLFSNKFKEVLTLRSIKLIKNYKIKLAGKKA